MSGKEEERLSQTKKREKDWQNWGAYLSDRAWGTVREDYSPDGAAWDYFPHEAARSRTFRWNEDGLGGICDRNQRICFALALWNERDPFLKERLFGLSGPEGNHGEDVKEYYFHLDAAPTFSYAKFLYKYCQNEYPYQELLEENRRRDKSQPEFELLDTGVFDRDEYFDVFIEYAKADANDIFIKITAINRGSQTAPLHVLPHVWFRNDWTWRDSEKPSIKEVSASNDVKSVMLSRFSRRTENVRRMFFSAASAEEILFTENETNNEKLFGVPNASPYVKDAFHRYFANDEKSAVNPEKVGTKACAVYRLDIEPSAEKVIYLRLSEDDFSHLSAEELSRTAEDFLSMRRVETDEFYASIIPQTLSADAQSVMRQSFAGLNWTKQYYHYIVREWLDGDPAAPAPPASRVKGRNKDWRHLYNSDIISMPDKWEYPWYAAWDLAFHCVAFALFDSEFAKHQLILLVREWYMHPNGQIPAYEWKFDDVNPPVHAWAALRVFQMERRRCGTGDYEFLEKIFHKLLLNFTWWVNRKDTEGNNVFEGGFLGLDNIGVFDRSGTIPGGGVLEQSDGTSWMAMFSLNMFAIAVELAVQNKAYEDVATKFFEHFIYISDAINNIGEGNTELWSDRDGFFYDVLHLPDGESIPLRVRSLVGLIPLFAVETIEAAQLDELPDLARRIKWFLENRSDLTNGISCLQEQGQNGRRLLSIVSEEKLRRVLRIMLDETEFLSDYGIRSLSRHHKNRPYVLTLGGETFQVDYEPAESSSRMFGGNSNWRGPIWFPMNYLLIESLQKFDYFYGADLKVEYPTGSGEMLTLWEVSQKIERRLAKIFLRDEEGRRAVNGIAEKFQTDPHWRDLILFYEYFQGDNGSGLGASHQTGWTAVIAKMLQQMAEYGTEI